jgi:hypothetical protein
MLALWKRRLPLPTQQDLAALVDEGTATLAHVANGIHELPQTPGQIAAATPVRTATMDDRQNRSGDTRYDRLVGRMDKILSTLSLGEGRRPGRRFRDYRRGGPPLDAADLSPGKMACASTTKDSANGRRSASNLAGGTRETLAAVRRRVVRRRLRILPHFCN